MRKYSMVEIKALISAGIFGVLALLLGQEAQANIPNWTRKYNLPMIFLSHHVSAVEPNRY